jgi:hypothetical protein
MTDRSRSAGFFCAIAAAYACSASAAVTYETVAFTGRELPGLPAGTKFAAVFDPTIGADGRVAFRGNLVAGAGGVTTANDDAIWLRGAPGEPLDLVARQASSVPGMSPAATFDALLAPLAVSGPTVVFRASFAEAGVVTASNPVGIWSRHPTAGVRLIARTGAAAPDAPAGATFAGLGDAWVASTGRVVWNATLKTGTGGVTFGNNAGIWAADAGGTTRLIARNGDAAAGLAAHTYFQVDVPTMNAGGTVAFQTGVSSSSGVPRDAIYRFRPDGTGAPVVVTGDVAPGTGTATSAPLTFTRVAGRQLNGAGQVLFEASLSGSTRTSASVWRAGPDGQLHMLLRAGAAAPGTGSATVRFAGFAPRLTVGGDVAYAASLASDLAADGVSASNDSAVYAPVNGAHAMVAREGQAAPGAGLAFADFMSYGPTIVAGPQGQVAFRHLLSDLWTDGIWMSDSAGSLHAIAIEGQPFAAAANRIVSQATLGVSQSTDPLRRTQFDDAGNLVFQLHFTDGTAGIFQAAVPEPTVAAPLAVAVIGTLIGRRPGQRRAAPNGF